MKGRLQERGGTCTNDGRLAGNSRPKWCWKQEFIERAPEVFERQRGQSQQDERVAELERVIGRLTVELEMAKKASLLLKSHHNGGKPW